MSKILKAIHKGELNIGNITMSCAVLEDGTRIIGENGINNNLGISGGKSYKLRQKLVEKRGGPMPMFLASTALEPFINDVFDESDLIPVKYQTGDNISVGYKAEILPKVCEIWLIAREEKTLQTSQYTKAKNAEILLRGLAKVGITALVDEATGYQYEREKDELQRVLEAYISKELLKWQKMFPDGFYFEIFRLNNWDYTVNGIKKRPGVIGKWTNELIYNQLPKGVLEELKAKTPKSVEGNYTARFFQSLTPDIGHPALTAQIYKVVGLMQISNNWNEFKSHFNRMVDRNNGQMEIDFDAVELSIEKEEEIKPEKLSKFNRDLQTAINFNPNKNKEV